MYDIHWDQAARDDMRRLKLRTREVGRIIDAVEEQLTHQAERPSKRKKLIRPGERLPFEHAEAVWQLRVAEFRVFYDVSQPAGEEVGQAEEVVSVVRIRAVRRKPPHRTTREIL